MVHCQTVRGTNESCKVFQIICKKMKLFSYILVTSILFGFIICQDDKEALLIEALKRDMDAVLSQLQKEIETEIENFEKLAKSYAMYCHEGNRSSDDKSMELENDAWNLRQIGRRCQHRIRRLKQQTKLRPNNEVGQLEELLQEMTDSVRGLNSTLTERANENHNQVEDLRLDVVYLSNLDHNSLNYLVTKSPWRPIVTKLGHRLIKLRITACPNWILHCFIEDMASVDEDSFVVTYTNQSYIRHFTTSGLLLSEYRFPWNLGGIAGINQTHVLVGVPQKKAFLILEVTGGLKVLQHVFMDVDCGNEVGTLKNGYMMICRNGESNSLRTYDSQWKLQKSENITKSTLFRHIGQKYKDKKVIQQPNGFPSSVKGAVFNQRVNLWYSVATATNVVQSVRLGNITKKDMFYVHNPTAIVLLHKYRKLVVGTERGIIYISVI